MDLIKPIKGLSKDLKEKMFYLIKVENQSEELITFLELIFKDSIVISNRFFCKAIWRDLVKAFASSYPFCSFIPPCEEYFDFLESVFSEPKTALHNDTFVQKLHTTVPVIFKLLSKLKEVFPFKEFNDCLPYFQQKVFDHFLKDLRPSEDPDNEDGLSFSPSLQRVRRRGHFVADKKRTMTNDMYTKLSKGHPSLLPGVFTLLCPDGKLISYETTALNFFFLLITSRQVRKCIELTFFMLFEQLNLHQMIII